MWTARDRTRARGGDGARETDARAHLEASETVAPRASMVRGRRTSAGREVRRRTAAGRVAPNAPNGSSRGGSVRISRTHRVARVI